MTKVSLHRFVSLPQRFLLALGLGLGILTVGAISPPPSLTEEGDSGSAIVVVDQFTTLPEALIATEQLWAATVENLPDLLTVTLYTPTLTCEEYAAEEVAIAQDKALSQIVYRLMVEQVPELINFELAGYRIQTSPKGNSVTIDFRREPNALRQFTSLSICERRILFGSLRETLLRNSRLGVEAVVFTEQGRLLDL